ARRRGGPSLPAHAGLPPAVLFGPDGRIRRPLDRLDLPGPALPRHPGAGAAGRGCSARGAAHRRAKGFRAVVLGLLDRRLTDPVSVSGAGRGGLLGDRPLRPEPAPPLAGGPPGTVGGAGRRPPQAAA